MSIRVIDYIVTANNISPATVQKGGLQGEHRATTLQFELDRDFRNNLDPEIAIKPVADKIYYRFEAYTSTGLKNSTTPVYMDFDGLGQIITLEYPLENWLTRDGGNIRVYLIFSGENVDDAQTIDLYTYPALLRLDAVPDAEFTDGENYESITTLSVSAKEAAKRAENAADAAAGSATAADEAREQTENARFALENGAEFIFLGGDAKRETDIELVIDEQVSSVSENLVKNKAIYDAIEDAKEELKQYTDLEIATFDFIKIVDALPETGLPNRLYLVPKSDTQDNDLFDEYIWANGKWEFITTKQIEVDLTPYVKKTDVADYIVEQGTNGIWTYRKWNSGIAECWGKKNEAIICTEQRNSIYIDSIKQIDFPKNLFTSSPCVNLNAVNATGYNFLIPHVYSVDAAQVSYLPASTGIIKDAVTPSLIISAMGRWKESV